MGGKVGKKEKRRIAWKQCELCLLRAQYFLNKFPDEEEKSSIAVICQKNVDNVRVWFQNQRQRNEIEMTSDDVLNVLILSGIQK